MVLFRRDVPVIGRDWAVEVEVGRDSLAGSEWVVVRLINLGVEEIEIRIPPELVWEIVQNFKEILEGGEQL